jgi:RNA polymerase sigma-70 factor, ECF subfamily
MALSSQITAPAAHALSALMAFQAARLPARTDASGEIVLLEDQDRSKWDRRLVAMGFAHLERSAQGPEMTTYHVQAAIGAATRGPGQLRKRSGIRFSPCTTTWLRSIHPP